MSRIQHILEKAEREGAALRTSRLAAAPPVTTATVPVTIDIPSPPASDSPAVIVPGAPAVHAAAAPAVPGGVGTAPLTAAPMPAGDLEHFTVRLNPLLVAGLSPKSLAAEQYRALRTRIAHAEGSNALRTVLITSPQKGEGKSITAANLALTMAQELQRRVVIVEADLRKPSLQQLFGLPPGPGLAEYLAGAAEMKDVMKFLPDHNLTVIPAGTTPTNPAELLGSTAMRRMLDQLRTRYDRVLLDTPPVLPLADVAVLAPMVDGTLLVVRAGVTPKPAIENALRAFDSSRLIGIVLNESGLENDYRYEAPRH
jgi:capsular exopolysaccharide synthesis family protein